MASAHQGSARALIETLESRQLLASAGIVVPPANIVVSPARQIDNLNRGVVAVRTGTASIFVSWRLLVTDPSGIAFNVYRSANGATAVKLNGSPLTAGTNYMDTSATLSASNAYTVRPVVNGIEQTASPAFVLTANHETAPVFRVPLRDPLPGYVTKFVTAGDLDGDGTFDYVIDRLAPSTNEVATTTQRIEAYKSDGTFLWEVDLGPTSYDVDNIEPGAATIDVGNWDGFTVADMDGDGKAEVLLKTANGTKFADGATVVNANNDVQFISVINGMTGVERARVQWTTTYLSDGPMGMMFATGTVDGTHPSLYVKGKNRVGNGGFNQVVCAFIFDGTAITKQWQFNRGNQNLPDGHNIRVIDINGDGKDEFADIGFMLNSNGTLRYSLATTGGIVHGDRFYIGDLDPSRPGLEGYGIQQDNPSLLYDYYYDASTGAMIWQHFSTAVQDVGRGAVGDVDPRYPGAEVWAFNGVQSASTNTQVVTSAPWPAITIQWDGDLLSESMNDGKLEKWNYTTSGVDRLVTTWKVEANGYGTYPLGYGDVMGDWRDEVYMINTAQNSLSILTTDIPTTYRIPALAQDPAYRNGMSAKGYLQSHANDFFIGAGMATPPVFNVFTAGATGQFLTPTGLLATPETSDRVTLNWNPVAGQAAYTVYRATNALGPYTAIATVPIGTTTYTNSGLPASGQTYYYTVASRTALGVESYQSAVASAVISLPAPWTTQDIGSVGVAGFTTWQTNVFTVAASGADIGGTTDAFRFVSQPITTDGTLKAMILSQTKVGTWPKAGVMIRASTAANAAFVDVVAGPGKGVLMQWRTAAGVTGSVQVAGIALPVTVQLTRVGNVFTASYSADGSTWTTIGSPLTLTMPTNALAGVAVTSNNNAMLSVAQFLNVSWQPVATRTGPGISSRFLSGGVSDLTALASSSLPPRSAAGKGMEPAGGLVPLVTKAGGTAFSAVKVVPPVGAEDDLRLAYDRRLLNRAL